MAKREPYHKNITCPKCGNTGIVFLEEDGMYGDWNRTEINNIQGDFTTVTKININDELKVCCAKCKTNITI